MALATFNDLKASIADWATRSDFTGVIPDFITLAESTFNNGDAENDIDALRCREMETSDDLTVSSGVCTLPADFLEPISIVSGTRPPLRYMSHAQYKGAYPEGDGGEPSFYSIVGSDLIVSTDVTLTYYAKVPALADAVSGTNWLLTKAPNAYLFGSLFYLAVYNKAPDQAAGYRSLCATAISGLRRSDRKSRARTFSMSASGPTP